MLCILRTYKFYLIIIFISTISYLYINLVSKKKEIDLYELMIVLIKVLLILNK